MGGTLTGSSATSVVRRWVSLVADHVLPGALCAIVAVVQLQAAVTYWNGEGVAEGLDRFSTLWLVGQKLAGATFYFLVALLFGVRLPRKGKRAGPLAIVVALGGVLVLSLYGVLPTVDPSPERTIPAFALTTIGTAFSIVALLSLGRCFGVFPEARGIASRGPYAYIRHPLYLAEIVVAAGLVLPVLSIWTVVLFVAFIALQYARAILEERALTEAIPEYADYARRTWRIIPFVH